MSINILNFFHFSFITLWCMVIPMIDNIPMPYNKDDHRYKIALLLDDGLGVSEVAHRCSCSIQTVYSVLKSSQFVDWQRQSTLAELGGLGARAAVKCLIEIVKNKKAAASARVSAADKLLNYTGYSMHDQIGVEQSVASMTKEQLHNRMQELQREAANRATVATIEGQSEPVEPVGSVDDLLQ